MTDIQYRINMWGDGSYSVHRITRTRLKPTSFWSWVWPQYEEEVKRLSHGIPDESSAREVMMQDVHSQNPERPLRSTLYDKDGSLHTSHMPM